MRSPTRLAGALALGLLLTSGAVAAQTTHEEDYRFEDDDLLGDTLSSPPPLLKLRPKGRRVMLIRPRVSFRAELVKSVETL